MTQNDAFKLGTKIGISLLLLAIIIAPIPYFFLPESDSENTKDSSLLNKRQESIKGQLLLNGQYLTALLDEINSADQSIKVFMYVFQLDDLETKKGTPVHKIAKALKRKSVQGVRVEVILSSSKTREDLVKTNQRAARYLAESGINTKLKLTGNDNPIHGKIVLIDNRKLFVSNHNWTNPGLRKNAEVGVLFKGPGIETIASNRIEKEFKSFFSNLRQREPRKTQNTQETSGPHRELKEVGSTKFHPIRQFKFFFGESIRDPLLDLLNRANQSINIGMFFIMPKDAWGVESVVDKLVEKHRNGVSISIGLDNEAENLVPYLKRQGIDVRYYEKNKTQHVKAITVDEKFVFVGSQNISTPALSGKNWETGVVFKSPPIAGELNRYLEGLK